MPDVKGHIQRFFAYTSKFRAYSWNKDHPKKAPPPIYGTSKY